MSETVVTGSDRYKVILKMLRLVVDRRGDVNAECVLPSSSPPETTSSYAWLLIGIGVLLFVALVVGIIAYLLRNPEIFKNVGSNQSRTVTAHITATAPEAPPPYNHLPLSPYQSPAYTDVEHEEEHFIKRPLSRPQDAREAAGNQAANPYNKPFYEQEPGAVYPVPDPEPPIHDEDTMPSAWMPGGTTSNGDVNANSVVNDSNGNESEGASASLPVLLSAARDTTLVEQPAPKKRCVRQEPRDSNYGDNSNSSFPRSPSPSQGGPPYSFFTQITNVVQINTNK